MLWLLALYSILVTASFSYPQNPSSNEGQTISVSNPAGPFEMMDDSLSVSASTPLDDTNKLNPSSIPPLDDTAKVLGNLPGITNQQTQIDAPPQTTSTETPFAHISFDQNSEPPAAFNQALMDDDSPSFPLLDLFRSIPSDINIPNFGEGSSEQKPSDPNPVETGEEAKRPRYNPGERVGNPAPPECGEGRYAMCCNQGPAYSRSLSREPVWEQRRLCRLFGTNWEGCHWRQNVFCCVCKDKNLVAYGCFSPIYTHDPYYTPYGSTKRPPPPPEYFDRPTVDENVSQQRGRKPKVKPSPSPAQPQPPEPMGPPRLSARPRPFTIDTTDVLGRPRMDSTCTPEQLQYYRNGGKGVYMGF